MDDERFVDYMCWYFAGNGERFYPPNETAEKCVESLHGAPGIEEDREKLLAMEKAEHARAYENAVVFFEIVERRGDDPVFRACREVARSRGEGLEDLPYPNFEWWYGEE